MNKTNIFEDILTFLIIIFAIILLFFSFIYDFSCCFFKKINKITFEILNKFYTFIKNE